MMRLFAKTTAAQLSSLRTLENVRFVSQTPRLLEKSDASKPTTPPAESQSPTPTADAPQPAAEGSQPWQQKKSLHTVNNFDKRVLVSSGKYKTIDEVPERVAQETLDRARDRFRVKMCIYMMIICVLICIVQIFRGKNAAERGESVVNTNLEWHRQYNEGVTTKKENK
ncbi:UPF0389 protein GA21628 [Sitodiplosis mosellana]|uniref:UPF0389 protein GA21628 n=1 Tax=Sitodiplosis mosellana TaxID=263140 RepID=UPI0024447672|nr:UPF0389 protein GA21628 [Sitodiplosis mosellana]